MESNDEAKSEERPEGLLEAPKRPPNQIARRGFGNVVVGAFFTPQLFSFRPNDLRFLREFGPETSIEEAAEKAGVPVEYATRLLKRKAVRQFLADKFQQIAIQNGWTVERWMAEGDKVWRGAKVVSREQLDVWKEFGARILPKAKGAAMGDGSDKPQITINIGAVDEAFQRQRAIQAEIADAEQVG